MKKIYYVFILITLLSVSACMKSVKEDQFSDDSLSSVLKIAVQMPQGFNYTTQGLTISLSDPSSGLKFSGVTDNSGIATIRVAHGTYIATTQVSHSESGGVIYIFNGTTEKIRVTPKDPALINTNLSLNVSKAGQIVIKEFYYGGCFDVATNKSYSKDQYFILYNNTGETAYLDSLCVGIIDPYNAPTSGKTSQWVKKGSTEIRDSLPATGMGWMFPGTGKDNPLPPGGQIVVSLNAINHNATVSASVDLGKAGYWAIYDAIMTKNQSVPNAGVNLLKGFWKVGTATSYGYLLTDQTNQVIQFIEKPDIESAKVLIKKKAWWNIGIYTFSIPTLENICQQHQKKLYSFYLELKKANSKKIISLYQSAESVSFDYAFSEKTKNFILNLSLFNWSDIGEWKNLLALIHQSNITQLKPSLVVEHNSSNCLVSIPKNKIVGLVGVDNLAIIDTPDALLVCNLNQSFSVRDLIVKIVY
jgi:hypothetical protein